MFADLSHVSADTMRDVLRASRAPVIFSHSNAAALNPHPRNVPDDVLASLRDNGGVIHVNFIRAFVARDGFAWTQKQLAMQRELHARQLDAAAIKKETEAWEASTLPQPTIADVADHIDHIRKFAGIDHIGIGADYFDVKEATMVPGLGNVTRYPWLFAELLRRGYSDDDVLKIAGRNHLRAADGESRRGSAAHGNTVGDRATASGLTRDGTFTGDVRAAARASLLPAIPSATSPRPSPAA